ncbi:MAG: copper chaperone PCu(A)C [Pseudomonadota bacterium]
MQFSVLFRLLKTIGLACVLGASASGLAHEFKLGPIHVGHPAAPASLPGQTSAVVYLTIENQGTSVDRLVALTSPAAQSVMVHRMTMNGPVMAMREVEDLPLEPQKKMTLTAGSSYHIMMTGLRKPLVLQDKVPLVLTFERAGKLEVTVNIERSAADKTTDQATATHQH